MPVQPEIIQSEFEEQPGTVPSQSSALIDLGILRFVDNNNVKTNKKELSFSFLIPPRIVVLIGT